MNNDTQPTLPEDVQEFERELTLLLEKYDLHIEATIDFPIYKELPIEVRLALGVLNKHQGVLLPVYRRGKNAADKS